MAGINFTVDVFTSLFLSCSFDTYTFEYYFFSLLFIEFIKKEKGRRRRKDEPFYMGDKRVNYFEGSDIGSEHETKG
jgi:hypothetical protein